MRHAALATLLAAAACGGGSSGDHTGVDIVIKYQDGLEVKALEFSGWFEGLPAFGGDARPGPGEDRTLDPDGENLIVLLNPDLAGQTIFLRVDGVDLTGSLVGSTGREFEVVAGKIPVVELRLGDPRDCGNGEVHPTAELCDDGDQQGDDGCTGQCVPEGEWVCVGEPSICRKCGNGVCEAGEDLCSCNADCDAAYPDDGLCCAGGGETRCTSTDCVLEGEDVCGDGVCCGTEIADCGTGGDCQDCGNGTCEPDKGEDFCSCPGDCDPADPPVIDNNFCCSEVGEGPESNDCCQFGLIDGTCCFGEDSSANPADCCQNGFCGDGGCCPDAGETPEQCAECCNQVCKDGICCGENTSSCAQDCCPDRCDEVADGGCSGCCAQLCLADQIGCGFTCQAGCDCRFECEDNSMCTADCTKSACDVLCAPGAECDVTCAGAITPPGDAGVGGPVAHVGPSAGGNCVCRGAGCALSCNGAPTTSCGNDVYSCGPCPIDI